MAVGVTNIRIAGQDEFYAVRAFYHELIDQMEDAEYKPRWEKGVYPSDNYLKESIKNGELWVCQEDSAFIAAMILNCECNPEYNAVKWGIEADKEHVLIVHTLGVISGFQGKGISGKMIGKALEEARNRGMKSVRLDVLLGNLPAEKFYLKHGFKYLETIDMFYEDTGWTKFKMYECVL